MAEQKLNTNYYKGYMYNTYQTLPSLLPSAEESRRLFLARGSFYLQMKTPPLGVSEEYLESVKDAYVNSAMKDPSLLAALEDALKQPRL